jgi:signal peptidase I
MADRLTSPEAQLAEYARRDESGVHAENPNSPRRPVPVHPPLPVGILPAIQSLLYVLVVALFLIAFTVQPIRIPSASMEPTLLVGDFLLLDKQAVADDHGALLPPARIEHEDVIVFHDPVDDPSIHLVKRVIGLPGDRLHLRNGIVYRNGEPLDEQYAVRRPAGRDVFRDNFPLLANVDAAVNPDWWIRLRSLVHGGEVTVPPESYFVMGDNRNNSEDSRYWGFVPRSAIVGKPVLIYFSWKQADDDAEASGNEGPIHVVDRPFRLEDFRLGDFARWERTFRVVR